MPRRVGWWALAICLSWLALGVGAGAAQAQGTGYYVTFAARECDSYQDIFANKSRDDLMQTLEDLGPDSPYINTNYPVNPTMEDKAPQDECRPLVGWRFSFGVLPDLAPVTGPWGSLTAVDTGGLAQPPATESSVPLLDQNGNPVGNETIAGAVTVELTPQQLEVADAGEYALRVQGGLPDDPVLANVFNEGNPSEPLYAFGALRCAFDNQFGDNVEGVNYPAGVNHVFCYEYLVKPPPTSGLITIAKHVVNEIPPNEAPQDFPFNGTLSYNPDGFSLPNGGSADFYRAGGLDWAVTEGDVANYRLDAVDCSATRPEGGTPSSTFTHDGPTTTIHLVAGDHVTCTYENRFIPPPGGLTIRKITFGGVGRFGFTVRHLGSPATVRHAVARTNDPGAGAEAEPAPLELAPGRYLIQERLPITTDGTWHQRSAHCNDSSARSGAVVVRITSGTAVVCTFVNVFVPRGSLLITKVTQGATGSALFAITQPNDPAALYRQLATTGAAGVPAAARPLTAADGTGQLPLGTYQIVEQPPADTAAGSWTLTTVTCDGLVLPFAQGTVHLRLTPTSPNRHCVFVDTFTPAPTPPPPDPTPAPEPAPTPDPTPSYQLPDLSVTKQATTPVVTLGGTADFRITVANNSLDPAAQVILADRPPPGTTVVSARPSRGTCQTGPPIVCRLGTLEPRARVTIDVRLRVLTVGPTLVNRAVVGTASLDSNLANNVASATVRVRVPPPPRGGLG